ncbi:helix-turn-helix domain-containing protein [Streptomyces sediminimaris]|uniref:helix-turn-helix domain-containing protein n=1 Tax=Streptomyces sediminimaris TaxID=3383721 RepID=UPI00399AB018
MASLNVGNLGEYLREQRRSAQLSLRQLADAAGVSNPYLSQIERGLRKPSAEVLQQVAKALRISAETLYVRAGILDAERGGEERLREGATRAVILADPTLNERQKQVLLQIYESFRKENGFGSGPGDAESDQAPVDGAVVLTAEPGPDPTADQDAGEADGKGAGTDARESGTAIRRTRKTRTAGGRKPATRRTRPSDGSDAEPQEPHESQAPQDPQEPHDPQRPAG